MQPSIQLGSLLTVDPSIFKSPVQHVLRSYSEALTEPFKIVADVMAIPSEAVAEAIENDPRYRTTHPEAETRDYLPLGTDSVGFFVVDGKRIERCHSVGSVYGRMLKVMRMTPGHLIKYPDLRRAADIDDVSETLRTLKTQLRHCGYKIVSDPIRGVGIIFYGLEAI